MNGTLSKFAEAITGGLISALTSSEAILSGTGGWTTRDYIAVVLAGLIAFSAIAFVKSKNTPQQ